MQVKRIRKGRFLSVQVFYFVAAATTTWGIIIVLQGQSAVYLAYLAPLIGIYLTVAAGIQELDRRHAERETERRQQQVEAQRRFDERFAEVAKGVASTNPDDHPAAAAELMFFLRGENVAFHHQTYYYLLCHLKNWHDPTGSADRMLLRAFERAAHQVLPEVAHVPQADPLAYDESSETIPRHELHAALDFRNAYLEDVDLSQLDLGEADLRAAQLTGSNLSGSCLWRTQAREAILEGVDFRHANLEEAQFVNVDASGADFTCANLVAARFSPKGRLGGATLTRAQFVNARLQGACFNGADLCDTRFDGSNLRTASFHGVRINVAALRTVVHAKNDTWLYAHWDEEHLALLHQLASSTHGRFNKGKVRPPRIHPSDRPQAHYRHHPHRGYTPGRQRHTPPVSGSK